MDVNNLEIEVKFLEIDKTELIEKLKALGAEDQGEENISEMIFYDQNLEWKKSGKKFVRIRQSSRGAFLTFKNQLKDSVDGVIEHETKIDDADAAKNILEALGLIMFRHQEKKRHKFILDSVIVDIDTWPQIPTYVELEGPSEKSLQDVAEKLGYNWDKAVTGTAKHVIEKHYNIPVKDLKYFTFKKVE